MKLYLHVGLPKTATTYLHKYVFPKFNEDEIIYNPKEIMDEISKIYCGEISNGDEDDFIRNLTRKLNNYENKSILISDQNLSVDNYDLNFKKHINILKKIFPEAYVLIMLRFQPDWCLSMYKQSVHQCCIQSLNSFLNYDGDNFKFTSSPNEEINKPKTNVSNLDYVELLDTYFSVFKRENVFVTFYENFRNDNKSFIDNLCLKLGVTNNTKVYKVHYRGLSTLSMRIIMTIHTIFSWMHINIPYSLRNDSDLARIKYKALIQNAKDSKTRYKIPSIILGKIYLRIANCFTWVSLRNFMQNYFDKLIYVDWDLLEKNNLRKVLTREAYIKNKNLLEFFQEDEIPKLYLR